MKTLKVTFHYTEIMSKLIAIMRALIRGDMAISTRFVDCGGHQ
jgi:hypothetical protein